MPARFHLLHPGYIRDSGVTVGSSVSLIEDEGVVIVVDPGLVAEPDAILLPLRALGHSPEVDSGADDQAVLEESRKRILEVADLVVPGHGEPFRTERQR